MSFDVAVRRGSGLSQLYAADKTDVAVDHAGSDNSDGVAQPPLPRSHFTRMYRSTMFNVIIAGLISFTQPGIWNALNSKSPTTFDLPATSLLLTLAR